MCVHPVECYGNFTVGDLLRSVVSSWFCIEVSRHSLTGRLASCESAHRAPQRAAERKSQPPVSTGPESG